MHKGPIRASSILSPLLTIDFYMLNWFRSFPERRRRPILSTIRKPKLVVKWSGPKDKWVVVRKRTFWHVRPEKTQISLCIPTVWSVFVDRMKKFCILGYPNCAQWRFWSDCANCAGWSEFSLGAHVRRYVSFRFGSLIVLLDSIVYRHMRLLSWL